MHQHDASHKIANLYQSALSEPLVGLLHKFLRRYMNRKQILQLLQQHLSDDGYMKLLTTKVPITKPDARQKINHGRAKTRLAEIAKLLRGESEFYKSGDYLDVGSDDCNITKAIGNGLGFSHICAVDIGGAESCADVDFHTIDGKSLPFEDNQFTFITALQVLHHMVYLQDMLRELVRCSQDGALMLIREQDMTSAAHGQLFDVEHMLYDIVTLKSYDYAGFQENYYAKFHNRRQWHNILRQFGFEFIKWGRIDKFNPTNYYYALYVLRKRADA